MTAAYNYMCETLFQSIQTTSSQWKVIKLYWWDMVVRPGHLFPLSLDLDAIVECIFDDLSNVTWNNECFIKKFHTWCFINIEIAK